MLALDARLAAILRARGEPIAAQLRLAWWRDQLNQPRHAWPRGEPILEALRTWADPGGLAILADGWESLLKERLDADAISDFAEGRGAAFGLLARELAPDAQDRARALGRVWAAADLAAHLSNPAERQLAVDYGLSLERPLPVPRALRPLAVLSLMGARALRRGGASLLDRASLCWALRIGVIGR